MLAPRLGDCVVDCTAGGGGHIALMLDAVGPTGRVIAFDRDQQAIAAVKARHQVAINDGRLKLINSNFSKIKDETTRLLEGKKIDIIYADIGVSSHQIDTAERGFSFMKAGPLDMRMNGSEGATAADVLNSYNEKDIADILYRFGELHESRFIARKMVERRGKEPFSSTLDLANFMEKIMPRGQKKTHPATQVFQAIRIYVNDELGELQTLLSDSFEILKSGGRFGVISFHSLEDRMAKRAFQQLAGKTSSDLPREIAAMQPDAKALARIVKPFPAEAAEDELNQNVRSRSAKLRVIEKL